LTCAPLTSQADAFLVERPDSIVHDDALQGDRSAHKVRSGPTHAPCRLRFISCYYRSIEKMMTSCCRLEGPDRPQPVSRTSQSLDSGHARVSSVRGHICLLEKVAVSLSLSLSLSLLSVSVCLCLSLSLSLCLSLSLSLSLCFSLSVSLCLSLFVSLSVDYCVSLSCSLTHSLTHSLTIHSVSPRSRPQNRQRCSSPALHPKVPRGDRSA
jgi:hypothetical protein